ncbi:MAG TPA: hypothetical protein VFT88_05740 [Acidobacteriaceae bacterium]|nr:hypothetical protein [Acidobacteriaceae bacterium]
MAGIEFPAELQKRIEETGPVDLVVGVAGHAAREALCTRAAACLDGIAGKTVVAYAGGGGEEPEACSTGGIQLTAYPMPPSANSFTFWTDIALAQKNVLALAAAWKARACLVVHSDLSALEGGCARALLGPVLDGDMDLVMPLYRIGKYEGLLNKGLLAPLSRALFGRRVRFPLTLDFCVGSRVLPKFVEHGHRQNGVELLWPANTVTIAGGQIGQASVGFQHDLHTGDLDLSTVLAEFAGSLFQEAELHAAEWQRVRGSQPVSRFGESAAVQYEAHPVDPRPMVESFVLASRNLEEIWRLVLPPATMLELKRLARQSPDQFRMPDALWARIVYDFALAHRMRRMSRSHVLGALTPLYLGWVASYAHEVGGATLEETEKRLEQLSRAYEEQKPYFVSRWRWPERAS